MTSSAQRQQIDQNYDAFQRMLFSILPAHRDEYALIRNRTIVDYFDTAGEAFRFGVAHFQDRLFSIQEVTDEPIDLGLFSHVRGIEMAADGTPHSS